MENLYFGTKQMNYYDTPNRDFQMVVLLFSILLIAWIPAYFSNY